MATKVIGLERLRRKLNALPEAVRTQMRADLKKGAEEIVAMQRGLVPIADGDLHDSINWTFGEPPPTSATGAFRPRTAFVSADKEIKITIYAGDDKAFYARWVEFGTAPHSVVKGADISRNKRQKSKNYHPGTAARPYFFGPYRAMKKRVVSRVNRGIRKAVKKVSSG